MGPQREDSPEKVYRKVNASDTYVIIHIYIDLYVVYIVTSSIVTIAIIMIIIIISNISTIVILLLFLTLISYTYLIIPSTAGVLVVKTKLVFYYPYKIPAKN